MPLMTHNFRQDCSTNESYSFQPDHPITIRVRHFVDFFSRGLRTSKSVCEIASTFGLHNLAPHAVLASTPGRLFTRPMLSELPEPESQIGSAVSRRSSEQEHPACANKGQAEYHDAAESYAGPSKHVLKATSSLLRAGW